MKNPSEKKYSLDTNFPLNNGPFVLCDTPVPLGTSTALEHRPLLWHSVVNIDTENDMGL